jgi:multidrug resistance efflux pump
MMKRWGILFSVWMILALVTGCTGNAGAISGPIKASGTITAVEVKISPEMAGLVRHVEVNESDPVSEGMLLVQIDQDIIRSQLGNAEMTIANAEAAVQASKVALETARIQMERISQAVHLADTRKIKELWEESDDSNIESPEWYFTHGERLKAMELEVETARSKYESEKGKFDEFIKTIGISELAAAEIRLANAEEAFRNAKQLRDDKDDASSRTNLDTAVDDLYDAAKEELDDAQSDYDDLLNSDDLDDLKDARARVAAYQLRYYEAIDRYNNFLMGEDTLEYRTAQAAVTQAETAVKQAEAARDQAFSARNILEVQLMKTEIHSPIDGIVLTRNVEPGEMAALGTGLLVLGKLDILRVTVYVPEDRYGEVTLSETAQVSVDSFPDEIFTGKVIRIADQAEYTPRNVQTADGRKTTVFAVDIEIPNPDLKLKPEMPVDVVLGE